MLGGAREPEDQGPEAGGRSDRADDVDVAALARRRGDPAQRQESDRRGDGDVDQEDPAPGDALNDDAAEQEAEARAKPFHRGEHADGAVSCRPGGKRRHDQRQRGGLGKRGGGALGDARRDEHPGASGKASEGGRRRKSDDRYDEDRPAAEEIAAAPAEKQQRSERQRVAVDDPGDVAEVEPQGPVDRRQSDVHDRHVQDDHELNGRQQDQRARQRRRPPSSAAGRDGGGWCGLGGHLALLRGLGWRQAMPL